MRFELFVSPSLGKVPSLLVSLQRVNNALVCTTGGVVAVIFSASLFSQGGGGGAGGGAPCVCAHAQRCACLCLCLTFLQAVKRASSVCPICCCGVPL